MAEPTRTQLAGANVRAEMARRNISQRQLADRLGIAQQNLSQRLNGTVVWRIDELDRIADILDVPLQTLVATYRSIRA